jgi:hypothetical protein
MLELLNTPSELIR